MIVSTIAMLALASVHAFSSWLRGLREVPRSRLLSIAGGMSVAYVVLRLLPSIQESERTLEISGATVSFPFLKQHAYVLVLVSILLFYGLQRLAIRSRKRRTVEEGVDHTSSSVFWVHISLFIIMDALIGYVLSYRAELGLQAMLLFAIAMALKFVVDDHGLYVDHKDAYTHKGRWVLAAAVIVGWGIGTATSLPPVVPALLQAFIAGGVILNVLQEELPEARESRYWAFAVGAVAYAALLMAQ